MTDRTKRIVMMDDSDLFLEVGRTALEERGYEVSVLRDLSDVDRFSSNDNADLVLMDVQMPEAFGDDIGMVLREVRGLRAPIILLSSLDHAELERRAGDAGLDGFISKHDGIAAIVAQVERLIGPPRSAG